MEVNTTENKTLEQDYRDLAGLLSNIVDSLPIYFFVKDTGDNFSVLQPFDEPTLRTIS